MSYNVRAFDGKSLYEDKKFNKRYTGRELLNR